MSEATARSEFLKALGKDVLESPNEITADTVLDPWDSLAVVSTIVVIDDVFGKSVNGKALMACVTAGDILALVEAE